MNTWVRVFRMWWRVLLSLGLIVVAGSVCGQSVEPSSKSQAPKAVRVGDLSITIPAGWKRSSVGAEDEGYWQLDDPNAPEAFFSVIRDQTFEQFGSAVEVEKEEAGTLAGLSGRRIEGTLETAAGPSRTIIWELETSDGGSVALVGTAQKDSWKQLGPVFKRMLDSVQQVQTSVVNASPLPQNTPAGGTAPPSPAASSGAPVSVAGPNVSQVPSSASASPPSSPSPVGMRRYVHGRSDYQFLYPATWTLQEDNSLGSSDIDFDTLSDPTGRYQVVVSRVREPLANETAGLNRWLAQQKRYFPNAHVSQFRIAGYPAIRVTHVDRKTGRTVFRQSFAAQGCRYAITAYTPQGTPFDRIPNEVIQMLSTIKPLRDQASLAQWKEVRVGPFALRIPPDWQAASTSPARGLMGAFESGAEARFTIEKSTNRDGFTSMHSPLLVSERLRVGGRTATAYLGSLANRAGTRMAVVFDQAEQDGSSYCLACYAVDGKWAKYETTFRRILASVQCNATPGRTFGQNRQPIELLKRYPGINTFQGDGVYSVDAYANAVVVHDKRTGRTQTVWLHDESHQPYSVFRNSLRKRPDVARQLGQTLSRCVPVFEDRIRVQLFDGGVIIGETSTRAIWWGTHRTRRF